MDSNQYCIVLYLDPNNKVSPAYPPPTPSPRRSLFVVIKNEEIGTIEENVI